MLGTPYLTLIIAFETWSPNTQASQVDLVVKNLSADAGDIRHAGSIPRSRDSLEEGMATHSSISPGESHDQRSLAGYNLYCRKQSDKTEVT